MSSNSFPPHSGKAQSEDTQTQSDPRSFAQASVTRQPNSGPLTGSPLQTNPAEEQATRSSRSSRRSRKSESAFRTISEVADVLDVQQHVLRFWETKFSQVRPLKRGGGRRYYRPEDLALLTKIHHLLYTEGYTIKGVQKLLREQGKKAVLESPAASGQTAPQPANAQPQAVSTQEQGLGSRQRAQLESVLGDLKELRGIVSAE